MKLHRRNSKLADDYLTLQTGKAVRNSNIWPQLTKCPVLTFTARYFNVNSKAVRWNFRKKYTTSIGGSRGGACRAHALPYGTQFFHFCIHFHRKAPASEVHAPLNGCTPPPTGNPRSATDKVSL